VNAAWNSVLVGLPSLLIHLAVATGLLIGGVTLYVSIAPYHELRLIRQGNVAAAIVLSGQVLALTIPLSFMMASSINLPNIVLWGAVTIVLQFIVAAAARLLISHLPQSIERGEITPALVLACGQIVAGILNAAAVVG
jgi:putative membrane protein